MHRGMILWVVVALAATGCATGTPPPPVAPAAQAAAQPPVLPDSIRWVQSSAEYMAMTVQTYRIAMARVETAARGRAAGSWAVILDADETVINNTPYQEGLALEGARHSAERFTAWVRKKAATPVPGAAAFLTRVRELGGRIAIVTNRLQIECDDTAEVLRMNALAFDAVLCRPEGGPTSAPKTPRFEAVAAGQTAASRTPVEILAWVGDNILDFPGTAQSMRAQGVTAFSEFGVRWFVLPNPMYGSWQ
jgi:5'-nucleotidase (lipoprotein e(P4) family)